MSFVRYVLWHPESRKGEFEFLCSTQENWTKSKEGILKEYKEWYPEMGYQNYNEKTEKWEDAPLEEIIAESGGMPKMYKLTIEEIKP